jgi:hypothetical protein
MRDQIATQAMQGLLASGEWSDNVWSLARKSYEIAQAMMDVRDEIHIEECSLEAISKKVE